MSLFTSYIPEKRKPTIGDRIMVLDPINVLYNREIFFLHDIEDDIAILLKNLAYNVPVRVKLSAVYATDLFLCEREIKMGDAICKYRTDYSMHTYDDALAVGIIHDDSRTILSESKKVGAKWEFCTILGRISKKANLDAATHVDIDRFVPYVRINGRMMPFSKREEIIKKSSPGDVIETVYKVKCFSCKNYH